MSATLPFRGGAGPAAIGRRALLRGAGAAALLGAAGCQPFATGRHFAADPFTLGVASGYPGPQGVVLWTRLAPRPLEPGGGMPAEAVPVAWEVADDEGFHRPVAAGTAVAAPELAHAVHVEVSGLAPGRWYFYRFHAGGATSPTGRTRTGLPAGAPADRLRLAYASCQHYEQGYFAAYRHMVAGGPDLILHLGDYIYESSWGRDHVRKHDAPEPLTLDDYRIRHALYRSDRDLQAAHAACPWLVTWDDHEVDNDYAGAQSEHLDPPAAFLARRAAAYRAYYEHMPLPRAMLPVGPDARLYSRTGFGRLLDISMLDDRQYRDPQGCPPPARGGGARVVADCAALAEPSRSLLGAAQEAWLEAGLAAGSATWTVIGQQTLMAQIDRRRGPARAFWTDGWDGYPHARRRLLQAIAARPSLNALVLGGDVHAFWVADLKTDFDDDRAPVVATEVCGSSITSQAQPVTAHLAWAAENPHVKAVDAAHRGYVALDLTPAQAEFALVGMADVRQPGSPARVLSRWVVEPGRPGALPA
ncbi:MAG: alkaline phosphatase D family protein [Thalassobaculales bacterium]